MKIGVQVGSINHNHDDETLLEVEQDHKWLEDKDIIKAIKSLGLDLWFPGEYIKIVQLPDVPDFEPGEDL